ncbi:hypothetical protein MMC17_009581 [Xylographa soralifera]|nr:hypothetical protein [Xylographa soralifera]
MATCAACHGKLELEIEHEEETGDYEAMEGSSASNTNTTTVPDDVELNCGCHFHWQCLLNAYQITQCPNCSENIATVSNSGVDEQILCNLHNEGGLQEGLDILPLLVEESYLRAYPEERKARAFLEFCREGDVQAVFELLDDDGGEDEDDGAEILVPMEIADILQYQDPLGSLYSGLHIAVTSEKVEVIWLLLLIASGLEMHRFPPQVLQAAEQLGADRLFGVHGELLDIRTLRDADGQTAAMLASPSLGRIFDTSVLSVAG